MYSTFQVERPNPAANAHPSRGISVWTGGQVCRHVNKSGLVILSFINPGQGLLGCERRMSGLVPARSAAVLACERSNVIVDTDAAPVCALSASTLADIYE